MKVFCSRLAHGTRSTGCAVFLLSLAFLVAQHNAQAANTLTDGNSIITFDLSSGASSAGMTSWLVNGINQMQQQWFWFRVGNSGAESNLAALGPASISQPVGVTRELTVSYDRPGQFGVSIKYDLTGSSRPGLTEAITIANHTASPLDFHFFQYSHVTLGGSSANQSVSFGSDLSGITSVSQTGPGGQAFQSAVTVSANRAEAGLFNSTLTSLNDGNPTTLNNNASAGPGNVTWAMEWDFTAANNNIINPGSSKQISTLSQVPEPSVFALGALGMAGFLQFRRKRAR